MPEVRIGTKKEGVEYNFEFLSKHFVPRTEYEALKKQVEQITAEYSLSEEKEDELDFPEEILQKLPSEVAKTVQGVILNYQHDFPDFCFWGMRKALIDAIRIRFRRDGKEKKLYDENGDAYKLSAWIDLTKQERYINRSLARKLREEVKVFGDSASHDYMIDLHKEEVPSIFKHLRLALNRMYYEETKE